jgi:hypothetical protein
VIGSFLRQLCGQLDNVPDALLTAYTHSTRRGQYIPPKLDMMENCLVEIAKSRAVYLLIDALDESPCGQELAHVLLGLCEQSSKINALLASRSDFVIRKSISDVCYIELGHHITEMDGDIQDYINGRLSSDSLKHLSANIRDLVSCSLHLKSLGM